jgi:hypothetical protein
LRPPGLSEPGVKVSLHPGHAETLDTTATGRN